MACEFCKIISGESPAFIVGKDEQERYTAFLDRNPLAKYHTLAIPNTHYDSIWDMPEYSYSALMKFVRDIVKHYKRRLNNNRPIFTFIYGEHVKHAHVHIVPGESYNTRRVISQFNKTFNPDNRNKISNEEAYRILEELQTSSLIIR